MANDLRLIRIKSDRHRCLRWHRGGDCAHADESTAPTSWRSIRRIPGIDSQFKSVRGIKGISRIDIHAADAAAQVAELASSEFGHVDIVICNVTPRVDGT